MERAAYRVKFETLSHFTRSRIVLLDVLKKPAERGKAWKLAWKKRTERWRKKTNFLSGAPTVSRASVFQHFLPVLYELFGVGGHCDEDFV